jgi:hypothetical protein
MITGQIQQAIIKLYSQVVTVTGDTAYDADDNEVAYDLALVNEQSQKDDCKAKAKQLLSQTDWAVFPDVGLANSADFVTYRGILRGLVISPVVDAVFPDVPTAVWE